MKMGFNLRQSALPLIIFVFSCLILLALPGRSAASSQAFSVLQGTPQNGMLMSSTSDPDVAQLASASNAASLIGVVSVETDSVSQQTAGQVNVQTDGVANTLVSTLNGTITVGDQITASPVEGVGTKALANAWIVGVAEASFDAHSTGAIQTTLTDAQGGKHTVAVGRIPVAIKVTYYSTTSPNQDTSATWVPKIVQQIADSLAGKHVSTRALVFGFIIFLLGLISAGMIINSAVRGGFSAIARQPLAKMVVIRQEWKSFGIALVILVFAVFAAVVLLRVL